MLDVTTSLEVLTLGRFEVHRSQEQLTGGNWSRRKVVELFKLLLSYRATPPPSRASAGDSLAYVYA